VCAITKGHNKCTLAYAVKKKGEEDAWFTVGARVKVIEQGKKGLLVAIARAGGQWASGSSKEFTIVVRFDDGDYHYTQVQNKKDYVLNGRHLSTVTEAPADAPSDLISTMTQAIKGYYTYLQAKGNSSGDPRADATDGHTKRSRKRTQPLNMDKSPVRQRQGQKQSSADGDMSDDSASSSPKTRKSTSASGRRSKKKRPKTEDSDDGSDDSARTSRKRMSTSLTGVVKLILDAETARAEQARRQQKEHDERRAQERKEEREANAQERNEMQQLSREDRMRSDNTLRELVTTTLSSLTASRATICPPLPYYYQCPPQQQHAQYHYEQHPQHQQYYQLFPRQAQQQHPQNQQHRQYHQQPYPEHHQQQQHRSHQ
jgi:hypothetical protein